MQLVTWGQSHRPGRRLSCGDNAEMQHLLVDSGNDVEQGGLMTEAALRVLSQLVMSHGAPDPDVVHQVCCIMQSFVTQIFSAVGLVSHFTL